MNKKITWSAIVIIALIVVGMFVSKRADQHKQVSNNPIRIGAVLSLTGFAAPWGEYAKNGIDLAVKNINDAGGINGRKVEVVVEDDQTDGKHAVGAFDKLVSIDHVQGVIGGVFDFTAQPLIPLALKNQIPLISASNFRIAGGFDLNAQSFVMLTDFDKTIRKLEPYLASSSIKKLAVVHYQSTFGKEIAKTLNGVMLDIGRGGVLDYPYPQLGISDWKTTIIKLKGEGVDAVFLDMVGNDPLVFLRQAKQFGFTPQVVSYNGIKDAFTNPSDQSLLENAVILNWEVTAPAFADMYQKAYGVAATRSADKYFGAVYVLAQGIANSSDVPHVADYMAGSTFTTPNGVVHFTPEHSVMDTDVQIQVIKNGVITTWK